MKTIIRISLLAIFAGTTPMIKAPDAAATSQPLEVCVGGFDHGDTSEIQQALAEAQDFLPELNRIGATSHETYVRWYMFEPEERKFDFDYFDRYLDAHAAHDIKWVPFLIIGPAYTLPEWFYKGPRHQGYVCLEHNQESDIQSLWNPELRPLVTRAIKAFCSHYSGNPHIESVLLGVTGNYGESIYPASGLDWTQDKHGPYHTHAGWWCGDPHAIKDFQEHMKQKFASVRELNADLGTTFTAWSEVRPRLPEDWPTTAARQTQTLWYQGAMNDWCELWMSTAKELLPRTDVQLVVGGHAPPHHGMDLSAQIRLAARFGCGIRITNEDDRYHINFAMTRMVASACRQYGTFFSIEPAGLVTEKGVAGRIFNSSASGARGIHWYWHNFYPTTSTLAMWEKYRHFATQREPVIDTAVFYPRRWMNVRGDVEIGHMYEDFAWIRNATDYDFLDEQMMEDLIREKRQPYRHLIVREGSIEDDVTSSVIEDYLELSPKPRVTTFAPFEPQGERGMKFLPELTRKLHPEDDYTSGVFFSKFKDGSMLFLNQRPEPADLSKTHPRMVKKSVMVEPYGLVEIPAEELRSNPKE